MRPEFVAYWEQRKREGKRAYPGRLHSKDNLDAAAIGGVEIKDILAGKIAERQIPADVRRAFHQQYPHSGSLVETVHRLRHDPARLEGLISGIKGKLFEDEYAAWLNAGHLPAGYHAELAKSATQPTWDIRVLGPHGHTRELLQLKATASAEYIQRTMAEHPHLDIVTTHEVFQQAAQHSAGLQQHWIDSGIALHDLNQHTAGGVHEALVADPLAFHLPYLVLVLAVASEALSYGGGKITAKQLAANIGDRSMLALVASGCAWLAMAAAGASWVGAPAAVASRLLGGWVQRGWRERQTLRAGLLKARRLNSRLMVQS